MQNWHLIQSSICFRQNRDYFQHYGQTQESLNIRILIFRKEEIQLISMKKSYSLKYEKVTTLKLNDINVVYGETAIGEMKQRPIFSVIN